ncbi:MAG: hypothetical protein ACK6D3_09060 [Planctomycetaceae bacterium]|jgi:hypothetical protein
MPVFLRTFAISTCPVWLRHWVAVVVLGLCHVAAPLPAEERPLPLTAAKHLTWNRRLFERVDGVTFEMQRPHITGERLLTGDRPWESWQLGGMSSLLHENGKFRLWYGVSHGIRNGEEYAVAYAESDDGLHWTKPELGLVEYEGSRKNNLVVGYSSVVGQVFVDPNSPDAERYRMLAAIYPHQPGDPPRYLTLLSSPDGLRWTAPEKNVVREGEFALDTQSQAFWDRDRNHYVLFTRMGPWRQVGRSESRDPFRFPPPQHVLRPDAPEKADFYQAGVTKYEEAQQAYFALVPVFFHPGDERGQPTDGHPLLKFRYMGNEVSAVAPDTLDLHLFTSDDSIAWQRQGDHEPFIGLGPEGRFDSRSLYPGVGYAAVGDELWFYYSAYNCTHIESLDGDRPFEKYLGTITRATLRRDGFVAARARHSGGELRTHPITFTGDQLELNIDCSAGGFANVELQTPEGEPLPGFSLADGDRIYHNNPRKIVSWKGLSDLSSVAGRVVRLKIQLRDSKLYALQFGRKARDASR